MNQNKFLWGVIVVSIAVIILLGGCEGV